MEAIAQAHLSCGFPSQECDPMTAAIAARPGTSQVARLARAIEGYHNPQVRMLCARALKVSSSGETGAPS